jgi:hypothetical protein
VEHVFPAQNEDVPVHAVVVAPHWPFEPHVWTPPVSHRVVVGVQTALHWPTTTVPATQAPVGPHVCGTPLMHEVWPGAHAPVHVPVTHV